MFDSFNKWFGVQTGFGKYHFSNLFFTVDKAGHHMEYQPTFQLVEVIGLLKTADQYIVAHIFII